MEPLNRCSHFTPHRVRFSLRFPRVSDERSGVAADETGVGEVVHERVLPECQRREPESAFGSRHRWVTVTPVGPDSDQCRPLATARPMRDG
jgi:hypothetical protein